VTPTFEGAAGAEVGRAGDGGGGGAVGPAARLALLEVAGGHHLGWNDRRMTFDCRDSTAHTETQDFRRGG